MFLRERGANGEALLRFTGYVNIGTALEVSDFLDSDLSDGEVTLDFNQVTGIDYYGLSVLVSATSRSRCAVRLQGLGTRDIRVLRYLGLEPARLGIQDDPGLVEKG